MEFLPRTIFIAIATSQLYGIATGLAFGGSQATPPSILDWDHAAIEPTPTPFHHLDLLKRDDRPPNLCGWEGGDSGKPDYCPSPNGVTSTCFPQPSGGFACCAGSCEDYVAPTACEALGGSGGGTYTPELTGLTTYCTADAQCNTKTYIYEQGTPGTYTAAYCITYTPDYFPTIYDTTTTTSSYTPFTTSTTSSSTTSSSSSSSSSTSSTSTTSTSSASSSFSSATTSSVASTASSSSVAAPSNTQSLNPTSSTTAAPSGSSTNIGAIVGGVVGGVGALAIFALLGFLVYRHRSKQGGKSGQHGNAGPSDQSGPGGYSEKEIYPNPYPYDMKPTAAAELHSTRASPDLTGSQAGRTSELSSSNLAAVTNSYGTASPSPPPPLYQNQVGAQFGYGNEMYGSTGYQSPQYPAGAHEAMGSSPQMSFRAVPETHPHYREME